mmetsp:Transcript_15115/g.22271  ORF Transcript_15115/g.22271 Transcript_15115/m.22271 type:complete len:82 (-) Transcript_15115:136-381(-)
MEFATILAYVVRNGDIVITLLSIARIKQIAGMVRLAMDDVMIPVNAVPYMGIVEGLPSIVEGLPQNKYHQQRLENILNLLV